MTPFSGIRVVDATTTVAGAFCAHVLAEAGADVVRIVGPSPVPPEPAAAQNDWSAYFSQGIRFCEANAAASELAAADVVLTSAPHGDTHAQGLSCGQLLERYPTATIACLTPFGQTGPYAGFAADDVTLSALSGLADCTPGYPDARETHDEPPLQSLAPLAEFAGGLTAALCVSAAIAARLEGRDSPAHLEISSLEAAAALTVFEWGVTAYAGIAQGRRPGRRDIQPNLYLPCADGHTVVVAVSPSHWDALVEWMGSPAWAAEERFATATARMEVRDELEALIREWARTQTREEILQGALTRGVPCLPAVELSEILAEEHLGAGASLVTEGDRVFPADPIRVDGQRREGLHSARPAAPVLGDIRRSAAPLAGVRVLDLGQFVAAPFCGQLLASLGADVVVIEPAGAVPVSRLVNPFGGTPNEDASMCFNFVNRGKRSVRLDLKSAEGRALFESLVRETDIVIENFSRGGAKRLRVRREDLVSIRADVIVLSVSAFGRTGPWRDLVALHSGVIALSGLGSVTKDESGHPRLPGAAYPDVLTAAFAALAAVEALAHRSRTGSGCEVEIAMLDVVLAAVAGLVPGAAQGTSYEPYPSPFVRTSDGGFLAVSQPGAPDDVVGATALPRAEAMALLQARGIAAGAVLDMLDVVSDVHLVARGFVVEDDHPVTAGALMPGVPWLFDGTRPVVGGAPRLGEHSGDPDGNGWPISLRTVAVT